jgi:hypothetical protein
VDVADDDDDGEDDEEEEGVHRGRLAGDAEAAEVDPPAQARQLEEQARGEDHEEHHADHDRRPVQHNYDRWSSPPLRYTASPSLSLSLSDVLLLSARTTHTRRARSHDDVILLPCLSEKETKNFNKDIPYTYL